MDEENKINWPKIIEKVKPFAVGLVVEIVCWLVYILTFAMGKTWLDNLVKPSILIDLPWLFWGVNLLCVGLTMALGRLLGQWKNSKVQIILRTMLFWKIFVILTAIMLFVLHSLALGFAALLIVIGSCIVLLFRLFSLDKVSFYCLLPHGIWAIYWLVILYSMVMINPV